MGFKVPSNQTTLWFHDSMKNETGLGLPQGIRNIYEIDDVFSQHCHSCRTVQ